MNMNPENEAPLVDDQHEQLRLSTRLREAREILGLSQEYVADQLGIPRAAVSALESAKRKVSSIELKKLARLYRVKYEYFLGPEELPEEDRDRERFALRLYHTTKSLNRADREKLISYASFLQHAESPLPPPDDEE